MREPPFLLPLLRPRNRQKTLRPAHDQHRTTSEFLLHPIVQIFPVLFLHPVEHAVFRGIRPVAGGIGGKKIEAIENGFLRFLGSSVEGGTSQSRQRHLVWLDRGVLKVPFHGNREGQVVVG